jgi:hypothetical protein
MASSVWDMSNQMNFASAINPEGKMVFLRIMELYAGQIPLIIHWSDIAFIDTR